MPSCCRISWSRRSRACPAAPTRRTRRATTRATTRSTSPGTRSRAIGRGSPTGWTATCGAPRITRRSSARSAPRRHEMHEARPFTPDEMMTVAAARLLWNGCVCFVGIGLPSAAANLARFTHAPDIVLIYESGTVGTRPEVLPLSIGDGELAETADAIVPLPEIFAYWLHGGRVDVGFLGAAQIDRF